MTQTKRIDWRGDNWSQTAYNDKNEALGHLSYEPVGRHMHYCWYQYKDIRMSPGCLQEVRDKQKEMFRQRMTPTTNSNEGNKEGEKDVI